MERIIHRGIVPTLCFLLFLLPQAFGTNILATTGNDTYNSTATLGAYPLIVNQSINHGNENALVLSFGTGSNDMWAKLKFDIADLQSKIIENVSVHYYVPAAGCANMVNKNKVYWSVDNSWNENGTSGNWNDSLVPNWNHTISILNASAGWHTFDLALNASLLQYLYNASDAEGTLIIYEGLSGCAVTAETFNISSKEGGHAAFLNVTNDVYKSGYVEAINPHDLYFDFESGTWNATFFFEQDFEWDTDNNQIIPYDAASFYYRFDNSSNASLGYTDCSIVSPSAYKYTTIININQDQSLGHYDTYCFNLTLDHNGQIFYGAIKVIDYSTYCILGDCHDVRFYWAIYSPDLNIFSEPTLNPNPPMQGMNLSVQWTTSKDMYGNTKYRWYDVNNKSMTGWYYAYDSNSSYRQVHETIINGRYVNPVYYEIYLRGNGTDGTNYTSILWSFYASGNNTVFTVVTENTTVPGALQNIADTGFCSGVTGCLYVLTGILTAGFTGAAFFFGGKKFGIVTLLGCILVFGFEQWLPAYIVIPVLVIAVMIIVKPFKGLFGGGGDG